MPGLRRRAVHGARFGAHGATLLPVDSEHNAIWQALRAATAAGVRKLILTASGGPFRRWSTGDMAHATPEQAVRHPKWSMGAKISVDSATMMNKGLEMIEAHHLFGVPEAAIEVVVHPQSIVHSLVDFTRWLGAGPARRARHAHSDRLHAGLARRGLRPAPRLDLCAHSGLEFEPPDPSGFPALRLARLALRQGGAAPTVLNAANEVAVAAFLERRIGFLGIARTGGRCWSGCRAPLVMISTPSSPTMPRLGAWPPRSLPRPAVGVPA